MTTRRQGFLGHGFLGSVIALTLAFGAVLLSAAPQAFSTEGRQVLRCTFTDGKVRVFESGQFKITDAADLTFDIGAIDLNAQTAQLITKQGTDQLRIVRAINANHFLEVVTEGFLNMTTIYDPVESGGASPAVHSRHFGLLGQPVITQYTGFCEALK